MPLHYHSYATVIYYLCLHHHPFLLLCFDINCNLKYQLYRFNNLQQMTNSQQTVISVCYPEEIFDLDPGYD